jgi:hypothetical protein
MDGVKISTVEQVPLADSKPPQNGRPPLQNRQNSLECRRRLVNGGGCPEEALG